jgi:hypothetical protein
VCREKKNFYFRLFLYHPELGGGEKTYVIPISNGLEARGRSGWTHAYTYTNSQVSYVYLEGNFHCNLTKDLQLKWSSEGMDKGGATKVL